MRKLKRNKRYENNLIRRHLMLGIRGHLCYVSMQETKTGGLL